MYLFETLRAYTQVQVQVQVQLAVPTGRLSFRMYNMHIHS